MTSPNLTPLRVVDLSLAQLKTEFTTLATQARDSVHFSEMVEKRLPGTTATVTYCGPMFMGMAMSHYHGGSLSF